MTHFIHRIALVLFCCMMGFTVALSAAEVPDKSKVEALVRKLGDESFSIRQQAAKELRDMGGAVADQLRKLGNHPDPEIRSRLLGLIDDIASLSKELKWLDPKNLGKREYLSGSAKHRVKLTFRNLTEKPVRIFWIELDGKKRAWRGILKPGASAVCAQSYKGHVWLITDQDEKPLGVYKIDVDDPILAVRSKDLKK